MPPIPLGVDRPIWDRFFTVAPLVIIGSKEPDGTTSRRSTWRCRSGGRTPRSCAARNMACGTSRERQFTVSFPRPTEIVASSLAASPRCEDDSKPALGLLPRRPATTVDGVLIDDCYLYLECTLHSMLDGFGANSLIIGDVVAASASEDYLRMDDRDCGEQLFQPPLLVYASPCRYATLRETAQFPLPEGFSR
jgi:flavin reductase (DIM6/NTAB) family NADH-FMN oxidoreductase RutF